MTMPQLGTLLVAVIIAFCALIGFLAGAPKGYEDDDGFHEEDGKPFGYICPVCGEEIWDGEATEHTEEGLAHSSCVIL